MVGDSEGGRSIRRGRALLGVLFAVQIVLGVLAIDTSSGRSSAEPQRTDVAVPAGTAPLSAESGVSIAEQYAAQWMPDAVLMSVSQRVEWPPSDVPAETTEISGRGWIIYTFVSDGHFLSIYLDRATGSWLGDHVGRWNGKPNPLNLLTLPTSSTVAALTAEILGGREYRSGCPELRATSYVIFSVAQDDQGQSVPAWTVTYGDSRHRGKNDIVIRLDASTGNVITNEISPRPCEEPTEEP